MKRIAIKYNPYLTRVGALLAVVIAVSALLYGIFLLEAVAHTAKRTSMGREIRELTSQIGMLQAESLALTRQITPEHARSLGFIEPSMVSTVYASEASRSLSRGGF
jgi:hypothetical protein